MKKPLTTTLARIESCSPCTAGWKKLLRGLGKTQADNEPLTYSKIFEICGLRDALWTLRAEPQFEKEWRRMAVRFARSVEHLLKDKRSIAAVNSSEKYANGQVTKQQLEVAAYAAYIADAADAAEAAYAAHAAAADAAYADAHADAYAADADAVYADAAYAAVYAHREKIFLEVVG